MSDLLYAQAKAMLDESLPAISSLSNILAVLFNEMKECNWAGLYLYCPEEQSFYLGPFQGKAACTKIPLSKGVVGACGTKKEIMLVEDVHQFPGHIACDAASASEIVCPLMQGDTLLGVLDIDFLIPSAFDEVLAEQIIQISKLIAPLLAKIEMM